MPIRLRKFIGMILLLTLLIVYALLVMVFAVNHLPDASRLMQGLFYVVAGLVWVLPAGLLITWMHRSGTDTPG